MTTTDIRTAFADLSDTVTRLALADWLVEFGTDEDAPAIALLRRPAVPLEWGGLRPRVRVDDFLRGYLACAVWAAPEDEDGRQLDEDFTPQDVKGEELADAAEDCASFCADNAADLETFSEREGAEQAGHCFYLSRNRHGAGFLDYNSAAASRLQKAARVWGTRELFHDGDGRLYWGG